MNISPDISVPIFPKSDNDSVGILESLPTHTVVDRTSLSDNNHAPDIPTDTVFVDNNKRPTRTTTTPKYLQVYECDLPHSLQSNSSAQLVQSGKTTTLSQIIKTREIPILPFLLIFISELLFTFIWILHQAYRWKPVTRTVYPERLPQDHEKLPPVDVFICTADPSKEPSLGVMNTVLSAMALDYPPHKIAVYLSDDGGSFVTLNATREAWKFSKWWVLFVETEKKEIKKRYNEFKEALENNSVNASGSVSRDHAPTIEVMNDSDAKDSDKEEMPVLVYVAREKRPSHPHHFKAGALNVLIRVSAVISNAPYILVLDCDHYCNDPTSARQAMCFFLDPKISPKLAFVQFPQKFHNISQHDIYDARLHYYWRRWPGVDGIGGPTISGCNMYLKREALYRKKNIKNDIDINNMKKSYGSSNELIKSINETYKQYLLKDKKINGALEKEVHQLLASCTYDNHSDWGKEASGVHIFFGGGRLYDRWKMSTLQCMCYAALSFDPIYVVPFYGLAIIPQICLLHGIPLYPKVSDPFFVVFAFIFIASQLKHVQEVMFYGDSIWTSLYELRVWMMKSASCNLYATLGAFLDKFGLQEAHFNLTDKVVDDERETRFKKGIYDFQGSPMLIAPICSLYIFNLASFFIGMARIVNTHKANELLVQAFIPLFGAIVNYHVLEAMVVRTDKARISPSVSLLSVAITTFILCFGSLILIF
ncbi:hypothetical protein DH2020_044713 [Rehmannia glutinosa]|uniref:Cellulose synthase-like protein n=1 Tax=Rehmannia glutinosa TaxID=99300 RepID=A0ABR0UHW8_REHGL